jgi:hypothetical protein
MTATATTQASGTGSARAGGPSLSYQISRPNVGSVDGFLWKSRPEHEPRYAGPLRRTV